MPSSIYARAPRYGRGAQRPLKPWARDSAPRAFIRAYSIRCRCLLGDGRLPETGDTAPLYRDEQPVYKICITLLLFHDISADEEKWNATNGEGTATRAGVLVGGNRGGRGGACAGGSPSAGAGEARRRLWPQVGRSRTVPPARRRIRLPCRARCAFGRDAVLCTPLNHAHAVTQARTASPRSG